MADGKVVIDVLLDDGSIKKGVADIDGQLKGLGETGKKASLGIGKIVSALGLVALAAGAISLIKGSVQQAFGRIDTMESFERVMTVMTGSAEQANKALDKTNEIVTGTAYGLDVAAQGVQNFVTRGATVDQATKQVEAWGDAVAFYGKGSNEELNSVMDALAKMSTKGKVEMDQLNRLFEVGIDAVGMYATATGRSANDVQSDLSAGKISAEDFIDTVSTAMMEGTNGVTNISGAAKEAGASWGGSFDNMKAAVARGTISIIESIDNMLVNNGLPTMRDMVAEFGSKFESALKKAAEMIPAVVGKIKEVYNALKPWLPMIMPLAAAIGTFVLALTTLNSIVKAAQIVWAAFNLILAANPFVLIIAAVIALAAVIYLYWDEIKAFTIVAFTAIGAFFTMIWERIKSNFVLFLEIIKTVWTTVWTAIKTVGMAVWNGIKTVIVVIFNAIKTYITTVLNTYKTIFTVVWNAIKAVISGVVNGVKAVISKVWNGIKSITSSVFNAVKSKITSIWNGIKDNIIKPITNAKNKVSSTIGNLKSSFISKVSSLKSSISSKFNAIKDTMMKPVKAAASFIKRQVDKIKGFFSGMKIKLPKIKLPHFSLKGKLDLMPPGLSVPKLGVNWYAKGGVFPSNSPRLVGMGDAKVPEAAIPLKPSVLGMIGDRIAATMSVGSMPGSGKKVVIENVMIVDGYEIARSTEPFIDTMLGDSFRMESYLKGGR